MISTVMHLWGVVKLSLNKNRQVQQSIEPRDYPWPGLDIILSEIKERLGSQMTQIDHIDTKLGILLGVNGVMLTTGLAAVLNANLANRSVHPVVHALLLFAALSLALAFLFGSGAFGPHVFKRAPDPRGFRIEYLDKPVERAKLDLIDKIIEDFEYNETVISQKLTQIRRAFWFMKCAVITLVIGIALHVVAGGIFHGR